MSPKDQRPIKQEIRRLERRLKRLRELLKISDRNEVVALYDGDVDERIAVEADGLGGARVVRADGNYPIDYSARRTALPKRRSRRPRGSLSCGRQHRQPCRI